ncbi:hypothetical protein MIND_00559500 [Mycena indigotica]|uniref:Uncharacterized protein n=1 Tax=Mycena indigotica TaxID=2126181 RepID=A0A8H6SZI3_9AGAR|nr:uncharacterized protein MIND_00559500 [Mycena indigotica]KAF7307642.1 hypothetical protein MIND_00559500 [Mycena indigotica]
MLGHPENSALERLLLVQSFLNSQKGSLVRITARYLEAAPLSVIRTLLSGSPRVCLSYSFTRLTRDILRELEQEKTAETPALEELEVHKSIIACQLLCLPEFVSHIRAVRRLSLALRTEDDIALTSMTAPTLEHLTLNLVDTDINARFPSSFPRLREVRLSMMLNQAACVHFTQSTSSLLPTVLSPATCPVLETLVIELRWHLFINTQDLMLLAQVAKAVDRKLKVHPKPPLCLWEIDFGFEPVETIGERVLQSMPWAAEHRLVRWNEVVIPSEDDY